MGNWEKKKVEHIRVKIKKDSKKRPNRDGTNRPFGERGHNLHT
jgi:hypothetical protein